MKEKGELLLPDITSLNRKKAKATIVQLIDSLILTDGYVDIIWRA